MGLLNYTKMPFSFRGGWDTVVTVHPSVFKTFLLLVLPFSLIAPVTLLYVESRHSPTLLMHAEHFRWLAVALTFLIAEMLTVPLMGWLIRKLAAGHGRTVDFRDSYLLAAIVAVPMCLSSLALVLDDIWLMTSLVVLGLLVAASLLYHGSYVLLSLDDPFEAQSLSYQAFSVGGMVWVLLCSALVLPLLS
ncbi:MAG: DUF1282 family protein [Burkholderiales bacterium]|nr:DUF1282 family protein [Burkholderiales bacterium]